MNSRNLLGGTSDLRPFPPEDLDLTQSTANQQLASGNQQFFLLDYWRVLVKRLWVILGSLALMLVAAVVVSLHTTPMYRAAGQITINGENPNPLGFKENTATSENNSNVNVDLATQVRILKSDALTFEA